MIKLGRGVAAATLAVLALTGAALGQGYPPNSPQPYPAQPYPPQPYPAQSYPPQSYPPQSYPPQSYPAQARPGYPAQQGYPPQGYPAQNYPPQGYPAQNYPPQQGYPAQGAAPAQPTQAANPVCVRLEAQLASVDSYASDPNRAAQIKREEEAIAKQQADLDRTLAQAHRVGCAGQGFFSLFSGLSPQCGPLNTQIQQMRGNLDRMMSDLEQLKSGSSDRQSQHQAVVAQLAQNNCGAQYTAAARASGPQGFFEALLGGGTIVNPNGDGAPAGTYRTVCVRTCDGYYFPVSYSTVPGRFADDDRACHRLCPNAEVMLFSYRNPGEDVTQAVSATTQQQYTALPNAFRYRKELVSGCSCKRPGENWAEALRNTDDASTLENGDIIVNEKNEKALTQPRGPNGKPVTAGPASATPAPATPQPGEVTTKDAEGRTVRVVGPPFISSQ